MADPTEFEKSYESLMTEKRYAILDEDKNIIPANIMEWVKFIDSFENKIIKQEEINGKFISTVFLGIDHGFDGIPKWFETMVFRSKEDHTDLYCERYTTYKEAVEGHAKAVKMVENDEINEEEESND